MLLELWNQNKQLIHRLFAQFLVKYKTSRTHERTLKTGTVSLNGTLPKVFVILTYRRIGHAPSHGIPHLVGHPVGGRVPAAEVGGVDGAADDGAAPAGRADGGGGDGRGDAERGPGQRLRFAVHHHLVVVGGGGVGVVVVVDVGGVVLGRVHHSVHD